MKKYTPPLMGRTSKQTVARKKWLFGRKISKVAAYYQARHKSRDIDLLWMETPRFGQYYCYPCAIEMGEELLVYRTMSSENSKQKNEAITLRWLEMLNPETFEEEYTVESLEFKEFQKRFARYQNRELARERGEAFTEDEEVFADEEPAALPPGRDHDDWEED